MSSTSCWKREIQKLLNEAFKWVFPHLFGVDITGRGQNI
jgi:hypothetical protein